jgi:hypothetical protein
VVGLPLTPRPGDICPEKQLDIALAAQVSDGFTSSAFSAGEKIIR